MENMKFSKFVLLALLATGTMFAFTGCGDKKDEKSEKKEAKAEKKASDSAKELVDKMIKGVKDKDLKAVQSCMSEEGQPKSVEQLKEAEEMFSSFKYEKTVKVNDKYSLVCGTMTMKLGDTQETTKVAFHVKDGKIVDMEDNWEPKDKHK